MQRLIWYTHNGLFSVEQERILETDTGTMAGSLTLVITQECVTAALQSQVGRAVADAQVISGADLPSLPDGVVDTAKEFGSIMAKIDMVATFLGQLSEVNFD